MRACVHVFLSQFLCIFCGLNIIFRLLVQLEAKMCACICGERMWYNLWRYCFYLCPLNYIAVFSVNAETMWNTTHKRPAASCILCRTPLLVILILWFVFPLYQGWSSTSCIECRCWHRLGHGPVMGSKMSVDCLCRMRKLLVFLS